MGENPKTSAEQPVAQNKSPKRAWGDDITPERLAELKELFKRQAEWARQPNRDMKQSVFASVRLTGAEVFWLAAMALDEADD